MSIELDETASDPEASKKPTALAPGSPLGKYKLERVLGQGGMGVVWSARDPDLQRSIAIKVLKGAQAAPKLRQRLLREAVAMAKLKHPNVLTVYEVGTVGDRDYIAMELVEGTTLDHWLAARPPQEEVWSAILAAGRGLAAAHEAGVVHRDFKPHNVMRSKDGRVLVTDFGLARGVIGEGEEGELEAPGDTSVLDTALTHTGALIGTPAYMAPEQYHGATPDPRTDQFAFCVSAWQAFTGERPFQGNTLDEMKTAVAAGVANLPVGPPRAIRAVLARGLDPKPEARWPSLEELLDALVRAERLPRRRMRIYAALVAAGLLAAAITIAMLLRPSTVRNACDAPEQAFADAWSPAIRAQLARSANTPAFEKVAAAFEQFQGRWVDSYQKACRTRRAKTFPARVGCLDAVADQVNALTVMLQSAPPAAFEHFDAAGMLPQLAPCERPNPQPPPPLPAKGSAQRAQVLAVYGKLFDLARVATTALASASTALEREAEATGYMPLVALVIVMTADTYARYGEIQDARTTYRRALPIAKKAQDHRLQARAHLGLLELAMTELETPETNVAWKLDDQRAETELHRELQDTLTAARSAVNDDALLLGAVELLAADAYAAAAQWNRYKSAYTQALQHVHEARKQFDSLGDARRSAQAAAVEAEIYLDRGDDRALDDAMFVARRAADALEAAGMPMLPALEEIRRRVSFARGEYNEVHRIADRQTAHEVSPVTATITGRITPPSRALVVAWRGELTGDPRRVYIEPTAHWSPTMPAIDIVQADADGTFAIHAEPGWAIIAEVGDTRSLPQVIGKGPLALTLKPTVTQSGTIRGKNLLGVRAFAQYRVGESTWTLHVPVHRDGPFDLRGMPAGGAPTFGTVGHAGHGERTVRASTAQTLSWPVGQALEVITNDDGQVYVFAGKLEPPPTLYGDLVAPINRASDMAVADTRRVGASNTDAGREHYRPGDRHAVITGNEGDVTACVNPATKPGLMVFCRTLTIKPSVAIDYPDGRYAAGVTPIRIEP